MPKSDLLPAIFDFLHCCSTINLEITFAQLDIHIYHNGHFLKRITKPNSRILLYKPQNRKIAQMDLLDNIAFRFSFEFDKPTSQLYYKSKRLYLPQPLTEGFLEMDAEKLSFSFTINSPSNYVEITHVYRQIRSY
ncbi:MAG: hypothetical protein ABJN84_17210 [Flavobacteriaceae bacterium]